MWRRILLVCALLQAGTASTQQVQESPRPRLYAALGMGIINLDEKGLGLDVPVGFQLIMARYHLVASVQALDLALLQPRQDLNQEQRFVRTLVYGEPACYDTQTGYLVSSFRCGSDTKALLSLGADLSYTPVETSFFGGKPGKLAIGVGYRALNPRTVYGTLGLLFNTGAGAGGGFRVALGRRYVFVGASWVLAPRRLLGKH